MKIFGRLKISTEKVNKVLNLTKNYGGLLKNKNFKFIK